MAVFFYSEQLEKDNISPRDPGSRENGFMEPNCPAFHGTLSSFDKVSQDPIWEYHFRYILKKWGWPPWWEVVTVVMATVFFWYAIY